MPDIPKGPFSGHREPSDPNAGRLEGLRKQIEAEEKTGIRLPENLKEGDQIEELALEIKLDIIPGQIIYLYSARLGVLSLAYYDEKNTLSDFLGLKKPKRTIKESSGPVLMHWSAKNSHNTIHIEYHKGKCTVKKIMVYE